MEARISAALQSQEHMADFEEMRVSMPNRLISLVPMQAWALVTSSYGHPGRDEKVRFVCDSEWDP
jgi:hypothetical protein